MSPVRGRRRRSRLAAVLTAALLGCALGTAACLAPASADGSAEGRIDHVQTRGGSTQVLYSLPGAAASPDLDEVRVTLDGEPVTAEAAPASGGGSTVRRTTVLAIDASDSMREDGRFEDAKAAAEVFLSSAPEDVYVGIVTFAGRVTVAQTPSLDRAESSRVIEGLRLSTGTHLYDAVAKSASLLGTTGQRAILVLSDGRDTSSTELTDVTATLRKTETKVDVVALAQDATERALIAPLSEAGQGSVITATNATELRQAFADEAGALDDQLVITVSPPPGATASEGTLAIELTAGGTTYADSAFVTLAEGRTKEAAADVRTSLPVIEAGTFATSSTGLLTGLAGIGLALLLVALALVGGLGRRQPSLEDRIAVYTRQGAGQRASAPTPHGARAQAVEVTQRALAGRSFEQRLNDRLETAGMPLRAAEWLLLHAGIVVVGTGVVLLLTGGDLLLALLALLAALAGPWVHLSLRRSRRLRAFNSQLPETLQLLAGSLRAGLSIAQGMDTIVREGADPVAGEFRRALVETRLGVNVEDALESVADRMDSDDFRWTVMAIRIQRDVGGNLAELMLNVATTMREREFLRRQVKSLSAEGRFSAYILLAMPPLVMLFLLLTNGEYLQPLFVTPMGWVLLGGMTLLMAVGAFTMNRMIRLEV